MPRYIILQLFFKLTGEFETGFVDVVRHLHRPEINCCRHVRDSEGKQDATYYVEDPLPKALLHFCAPAPQTGIILCGAEVRSERRVFLW